jgi:hypothetical protein
VTDNDGERKRVESCTSKGPMLVAIVVLTMGGELCVILLKYCLLLVLPTTSTYHGRYVSIRKTWTFGSKMWAFEQITLYVVTLFIALYMCGCSRHAHDGFTFGRLALYMCAYIPTIVTLFFLFESTVRCSLLIKSQFICHQSLFFGIDSLFNPKRQVK